MTDRDMFEQFATLHNMPVLKVGEAYSNDETNYAWWIWQKALSISSDTNYADLIKQAVNRFLGWKLPSDFNPDGNINFYRQYEHNSPHYPIGTNLFTAEQAKEMFEYCLSAYKPQADDVRKDAEREWIPKFPVGSKVVFYQKHPESPLDKEPTFGTVESYYNWKTAECGEHYTIKMAVVDVDGIKIKVEHNCLLAIDKARE